MRAIGSVTQDFARGHYGHCCAVPDRARMSSEMTLVRQQTLRRTL